MKNETLETLKSRRSVRNYKPEQVDESLLRQVLEAGTYAPTGNGRQAVKIVAVQEPEAVRTLSRLNAAVAGKTDGDPFYGAPTVLLVLADTNYATWQLSGAAVLTNLLNAAQAVGLGSCWIHRAKEELESEEGKALSKAWGIPEGYAGVGHCILGYAAETPAAAPRKADYVLRV